MLRSQILFICVVWISEETAIIFLFNIDWLGFIIDSGCLLRGTDGSFKSDSYS
jgi:hypothetical protein